MNDVPLKPTLPPPQTTIQPGNDFYKFVNGNWLRHVKMPPYLSSYGVSEEIEDIVNEELMRILTDARMQVRQKSNKSLPPTTYLLGTLAESALNTPNQKNNIDFVERLLSSYQCIRNLDDVASTMADLLKHGIPTLLMFIVSPMESKSDVLRFTIAYGNLGLPDLHYYHIDSPSKQRTIVAYGKLLKQLGKTFHIEGLDRLIGLETVTAAEIIKSRDDNELVFTGSQLKSQFSAIPWDTLMKSSMGWSPSQFNTQKCLILSKSYISYVNRCFRTFTIDTWKMLFAGQTLLHALPILPPPFDDMEFELFGHRLRGQREKVPQKRLALRLAQEWLTASLGEAFLESHVSEEIKQQATSIATEIKDEAKRRAESIAWLFPETRKKAGRKVDSIYLGVAYPEQSPVDDSTQLHPDNLLQNVFELGYLDFKDDMKKIDTKLNPLEWDDAVFAVNAYYYNEGNRLILPAGMLRWPFFHVAAGDGWNFGGLGATIGHEICHAFDDDGKDYDEHGNRNPWWSRKERSRYLKKAKALIELFNETKYFGHTLNGELTLSENIADLGGVDIALSALKRRLDQQNIQGEARHKELCDFFISFAVSWRTKERKEKALQSLFMDVHAPPIARVNNIVCQFDDWYECFNVTPSHALYREPAKRIRIF